MPVYHSKQNDKAVKTACKASVLPLKSGNVHPSSSIYHRFEYKAIDDYIQDLSKDQLVNLLPKVRKMSILCMYILYLFVYSV